MGKAQFTHAKPVGLPKTIERLADLFAQIPGVGQKTARRYALFFAMGDLGDMGTAGQLTQVLTVARKTLHRCPRCYAITDSIGDEHCAGLCDICGDTKRDDRYLCVVATMQHMLAVEASGAYRGRYLILDKLISPLDGVNAGDLPLADFELLLTPGMEVILALPMTVDGDATAMVIQKELEDMGHVAISRIAAGMPHGGDLEHADQITLGRALADRKRTA